MTPPFRDYDATPDPKQSNHAPLRLWLIAIFILAIGCLALAVKAVAHESPAGWSYNWTCCSGQDCRPIAQSSIKETENGYIVPSGEVIPYGNTKIQNSQDQDFHWCTQGGKENTPTVCLYVPGRGS